MSSSTTASNRACPTPGTGACSSPVAGGFDYTVIVEYEPRHGLRGLLDRTLVRILVGRIVRRTLDNVGRALER